METLGRHHPAIRRIRALRREAARRRAEGVLVAEGYHLARAALDARVPIEEALVSPDALRGREGRRLVEELERRSILCRTTADSVMHTLQDARSPQPILLVARAAACALDAALDRSSDPALVVVAHAVQDPGNLGAMLRSADAAGATAFVVCGGGSDLHHPRAVRGSMGSIFRLPALAAAASEAIAALRDRGLRCLGSVPTGGERYHACDLRGPTAIFLGGEGAGLPPELLERLDSTLHVPMRAGVESLSVGAAAAVLLFEAARQRESPATTDGG